MKFVRPQVFLIAKTQVQHENTSKWLQTFGVNYEGISNTLPDQSGARVVALGGKRCYLSFVPNLQPNVSKVREDPAVYIDNVLKSAHGSVLEHATYTFAIEGVSRVFTGECNRHRAGVAISEGSMRYIRFDDISVVETQSMRDNPAFRALVQTAFSLVEGAYRQGEKIFDFEKLVDFGVKKLLTSALRRIVGMGVATGGVWTFNARALRHIIALRTTIHAEEEIREVFDQIASVMVKEEPLLFADFSRNDKGEWIPKYPKI